VGAGQKKRVLIVDDDPPIRALLTRVGSRAGLETETAKDGQEAYEKLAEAEYDIVIVDLMMPRVSGFELIEKIAELDPRPTVIVSTAMMNGDLARLDDSMIRRVIRKPFDVDAMTTALMETAKEIIDRRTFPKLSSSVEEPANEPRKPDH
jgi:two-component system, response regulator, stage 0 sporulation protein F